MAKLNGFESYLVTTGLQLLAEQMKEDIRETEKQGKNPIMTQGYVDMVVADAIHKINSFTAKTK